MMNTCEPGIIPLADGGWLATAWHPAPRIRGDPVLLVSPPGCEWERAHRVLARIAMRLADQGRSVLRLDLRGAGDSAGELGGQRPEHWQTDVADGMVELLRRSGARRAVLVGLRLGCRPLLAIAGHPAVSGLVLWEPLLSGAQQLDAWLAAERAWLAPLGAVPGMSPAGQPRACLGQAVPGPLAAALLAWGIPTTPPPRATLWISSRSEAPTWATRVVCPGPPFWEMDLEGLLIPVTMMGIVVAAIVSAGQDP